MVEFLKAENFAVRIEFLSVITTIFTKEEVIFVNNSSVERRKGKIWVEMGEFYLVVTKCVLNSDF